jgi:AGCS family alanine or glycine:cation symporter
VGTGNIGGVGLAVYLGGPAAIFWMLVTAALGMTTKFVEVTLSHKYREKISDGTMAGGPMYYMKNADFRLFGRKVNFQWLAIAFAVATVICSFGTGNLPQINNISNILFSTFGIDQMLTGAVLAVLLFLVIVGGIRRIASVTSRLVPIMAILYIAGALFVIAYNYENIVPSFLSIFTDVFTGTAVGGGFLGAGFAFAFNRGVNRGLFSNEAGQGSAPIAHASARAHEPVSEGMVAILEPFIDTIIICTITGLVILSSGVWHEKHINEFQRTDLKILNRSYDESDPADLQVLFEHLNHDVPIEYYSGLLDVKGGEIQNDITLLHARSIAEDVHVLKDEKPFTGELPVKEGDIDDTAGTFTLTGRSLIHSAPLTAEAFTRSILGPYGQYIVAIGLLLFAFSTAISWSYYGDRSMIFLFGPGSVMYYRIAYVLGFFLASFTDTTIIWTFSGITIALMTLPNLVGIMMLHKEMKKTVQEYWDGFDSEYPEIRAGKRR